MHHEVQAVRVSGDKGKAADIPAGLGTIALVGEAGRGCVTAGAEIPMILGGVGVGRHSDHGRGVRLVYGSDGCFPATTNRVRRDRCPSELPVSVKTRRIGRRVGNEQRRKQRAAGEIGSVRVLATNTWVAHTTGVYD